MANKDPTKIDLLRRLADLGLKPPKTVTLAVTNRCNLSCRHCWPESGPDDQASVVPKSQVLRMIDALAALGITQLIITGGEPLTRPDWFDILAHACTRPSIEEVRLQTNAILIGPDQVAAMLKLRHHGLVIQTSLEGASASAHDRVRGKGSFDLTIKGLRLMEANGLASRICVTFTEMAHNFEAIPDLLELVDEMGIQQFVTGTLVAGGRAQSSSSLKPPTPAQYERLLLRYQREKAFRDRYDRMGNIAALEWSLAADDTPEPCCTFLETPYITAEGLFYPCVMLHAEAYAARDVFERPLADTLLEKIDAWSQLQQIKTARLSQLATCKDCHAYPSCGAGCMGRAYSAYGDFFAVEDRCQLRQAVYGHQIDSQ
jgi:radical SAM protein with 4Fe4S-binding SPASM domain